MAKKAELEAIHKNQCPFMYEKGKLLPLDQLKEKIYCIPDRKGRPMYYILDPRTGALKFLSYQKLINICTTTDPEKRQALVNKCLDRALIRRFSDDIGYIKEFLENLKYINSINTKFIGRPSKLIPFLLEKKFWDTKCPCLITQALRQRI